MPKPAQWFEIPAGTKPFTCRGCDEQGYWINTTNNKRMLVDLSADGSAAPTKTTDGVGVSHFARCPKADHFRAPR